MAPREVLVLGGYGNFGKRIVELLLRRDIPVIVAGRDLAKASALTQSHQGKPVRAAAFDMRQDLAAQLQTLRPAVVVNTCGPFQHLD